MMRSRPAIAREAIAFQDDVDALVAEPAPLLLRCWPALAALMLLSLLLVAGFSRIDVVVTAQGRLVPDAPPVVMQPIERAVLRELLVRPGEAVREGQVLALLDATFTEADRDALAAQQRALSAQRARLEDELEGRGPAAARDAEAALQSRLQGERDGVLAARRAALDEELRGLDSALRMEREAVAGIDEQLAIAREVEAMRARLAEGQVGSRLNLLAARAARLEAEQAQRSAAARIADLQHRQIARRAELASFLQDWRRQLFEELARVRTELARVEEQLAKAMRMDALTTLRAPRDGVVLEVARRAPGSVVREGDAVVVLVPSDVPLIAEIGLRSSDIGRLQPGDQAVLKIDAFPWRRHGALEGRLRSVSRESQSAPGVAAQHRAHLEVQGGAMRGLVDGGAPTAGMTLVAEIKVGSRSVLEFFLEPLIRGLVESLREP